VTEDGECAACGSDLILSLFLNDDGEVEAAVICPNCDQIEPKDVIRPDDDDDD
jgi:hypothetical protein